MGIMTTAIAIMGKRITIFKNVFSLSFSFAYNLKVKNSF